MRQPNSQRHRDRDHGYQPNGGSGASGPATGNSHDAEVVVNGRGNDSSGDSVGSSGHRGQGRLSPHGLELETKASRLGQAANPNRAEMPGGSSRRPSYDPTNVSGCETCHGHACVACMYMSHACCVHVLLCIWLLCVIPN